MNPGALPAGTGTGEPCMVSAPVLESIENTEMSLEARFATKAKCPEGSCTMTLDSLPPVGSVSLGVSWPVWRSMAKVEMVFDIQFDATTNRAAALGVGVGVGVGEDGDL